MGAPVAGALDHTRETIMPKTSIKRIARQPKAPKRVGPRSRTATAKHRTNTKSAKIIGLLVGRTGATIDELVSATGWQQHSVRGFLSGTLKKKQGLDVTSESVDGVRRYRIAERGTQQ